MSCLSQKIYFSQESFLRHLPWKIHPCRIERAFIWRDSGKISLCSDRQTIEFEEHWLTCGISTDKGQKQADLEDQKTKAAFVAS